MSGCYKCYHYTITPNDLWLLDLAMWRGALILGLFFVGCAEALCRQNSDCGGKFSRCTIPDGALNGTCDCSQARYEPDGRLSKVASSRSPCVMLLQSVLDPVCTETFCTLEPKLFPVLLITSHVGAAIVIIVCTLCLMALHRAEKFKLNVTTLAQAFLVASSITNHLRDSVDPYGCRDVIPRTAMNIVFWFVRCISCVLMPRVAAGCRSAC